MGLAPKANGPNLTWWAVQPAFSSSLLPLPWPGSKYCWHGSTPFKNRFSRFNYLPHDSRAALDYRALQWYQAWTAKCPVWHERSLSSWTNSGISRVWAGDLPWHSCTLPECCLSAFHRQQSIPLQSPWNITYVYYSAFHLLFPKYLAS